VRSIEGAMPYASSAIARRSTRAISLREQELKTLALVSPLAAVASDTAGVSSPRVSVEAAERLKFGNLIHFSVQRFWRIGNAKITFTGDSAVLVSKGILFSWKVGCRVS
jgi:hypothetical protein